MDAHLNKQSMEKMSSTYSFIHYFFKKTLHSMVAIEKQRTLYLDTKENVISVVEFFLGVFLCADPAGGVAG